MTEFLVLTKDELEKLVKNEPVLADIGRPIVLCSKEYFEWQKEKFERQKMRTIDADELKEAFAEYGEKAKFTQGACQRLIDNAPTVERPQGECKSCRHRDPEDMKCDCGGLERQGCPFPVSDDYYCKYYERGKEG